jgi:hypothetical protein
MGRDKDGGFMTMQCPLFAKEAADAPPDCWTSLDESPSRQYAGLFEPSLDRPGTAG